MIHNTYRSEYSSMYTSECSSMYDTIYIYIIDEYSLLKWILNIHLCMRSEYSSMYDTCKIYVLYIDEFCTLIRMKCMVNINIHMCEISLIYACTHICVHKYM